MTPLALAAALALAAPDGPDLTWRLTVSPAPAPAPVLKYELLPPARDVAPGNAAVWYLRAAVQSPKPLRDPDADRARRDRISDWRQLPLDQLPADAVERELRSYRDALRSVDAAARCSRCDWGPPARPTITNAHYSSAELQLFREMTEVLRLRFRADLAAGKADDAARALQTQFQFARHVGEGSSVIAGLVGMAMLAFAFESVEDWVQRPGAPNLYWALAALPRPLLDLRPMLDGEDAQLANTFPFFAALDAGPLPPAEVERLVAPHRKDFEALVEVSGFVAERGLAAGGRKPDVDEVVATVFELAFRFAGEPSAVEQAAKQLDWAAYLFRTAPPARAELKGRGRAAAAVDAMPPAQAVYLAAWLRFRDLQQEYRAAMLLPPADGRREVGRVTGRTKEALARHADDRVFRALAFLLPAQEKTHGAWLRGERRVAALQAVEALRLHAAATGAWPKALADVKLVAVPDDPATGKPFEYAVAGGTAVLTGPPPAKEPPTRTNSLKYELTVRRDPSSGGR